MSVVGIDIGTTSLCAVCYDAGERRILKKAAAANCFLPGTAESGAYAQDPERIAELAEQLAAQVWEADVEAVGISSQMHGIVYLDEKGIACSPFFTWKNQFGEELWEEGKSYAACLTERTGLQIAAGFGTATHFRMQQRGEIPREAVCFAGIGDYVAMRLTGADAPAVEASMAASFGGYDLKQKGFAWDILEKAGVDTGYYPNTAAAGAVVGTYRGVRVFCACGDNQASFLGAVERPADSISVNVGTGSQVSVFGRELMETDAADIRPFFGRGYLYVGATLTGGKVYERLAAFFAEILEEISGIKTDGYQITEKFLQRAGETDLVVTPTIYGSRDGSRRGGSVENLTEQNFHPADLAAGVVQGMARELLELYEKMPEQLRRGRTMIVASGNGLRRNRALAEAAAKAFGLPVVFSEGEEEAAVGAAMYASEWGKS